MKYLLLLYKTESLNDNSPEALKPWFDFNDKHKDVIIGGDALEPISSATTVQIRNEKVLTVDGPFAETKEQLGGYYMIDVANLDEAIKVSEDIPLVVDGSVEIRPLMNFDNI